MIPRLIFLCKNSVEDGVEDFRLISLLDSLCALALSLVFALTSGGGGGGRGRGGQIENMCWQVTEKNKYLHKIRRWKALVTNFCISIITASEAFTCSNRRNILADYQIIVYS